SMTGPIVYVQNADGIFFKLAEGKGTNDAVIHLANQDQGVRVLGAEEFPVQGEVVKIASLMGFIKLKLNRYAIIANTVEETGRFNGHVFYRVLQHSIVSTKFNSRIDSEEAEYIKLLELHLKNSTFYFSYTYDLTNSLQRNEKVGPAASWKTADERFFWNHYLTEDLRNFAHQDPRIDSFIQPVIYGYAKTVDAVLNATPIVLGLITRRSIFRAGTRYFRRGVDKDGNVGNFNETEQILLAENPESEKIHVFSFLQTRGSVPIYWAEINNLKYKPNLVLGENSLDATKKHFDQQKELYGDNYLVNLVNQKGHELPVKEGYESVVHALNDPKIHYVYFDFHHECRKMQWHRVKLLIDHLEKLGLSNEDFFHKVIDSNGNTVEIVNEQHSVVRTNCMDCLDRTNVVQSVLAQWVLQKEFESADVVATGSTWEDNAPLLTSYQNLWADNADAVSVAYSGTGALKTDFTRTGKRTRLGAFNDFLNSASRYYQNNWTDGPRQDSYDLFLGG
uniref:Phosphoinositide phosphatase SAC1 n=1 Tax=Saccharomyces cerevisiae TaxID=4932 RepID=UPI0001D192F3|nr:Chain X, Phosphoinositide phosphatase SAC1 [Saccharomyces cerevisiae]